MTTLGSVKYSCSLGIGGIWRSQWPDRSSTQMSQRKPVAEDQRPRLDGASCRFLAGRHVVHARTCAACELAGRIIRCGSEDGGNEKAKQGHDGGAIRAKALGYCLRPGCQRMRIASNNVRNARTTDSTDDPREEPGWSRILDGDNWVRNARDSRGRGFYSMFSPR